MKPRVNKLPLYAVIGALVLTSATALAERPDWAGRRGGDDHQERRGDDRHGGGRDEGRYERRGDDRSGPDVQINIGGFFGERQRDDVRGYYREHYRGGHCPPGLAKKDNGCMPPGQARKWGIGRPLPRDVIYYPVEQDVRVRLGTPPAGHDFVRVAGDILLIAVGTAMVIDAIEDLQGR